ncbi:hypothetical protein DH2020_046527 [Rehmannia glutinosa]|uniref:Uncharacterized protein n=1 Tax=Rehmannia glutinosa TaxID=99300 RepID=A0ABR0UB47_REHGL
MGNNWLFFVEPDGGSSGIFPMDPLLPQSFGVHWLSHITSFVDNSRYLYVPGSSVLQEAFNCMSKFAGALVVWFGSGSNCNVGHKLPGSHSSCSNSSTQVKNISSVRQDLTGFFSKSKHRRKSAIPVVFGKMSSFALKQMCKEAERLQSFPLLSLAAALVPPFTNVSSNVLAIPLETSSVEAQRCVDQNPCDIENRGCGPCSDLYFQNLAWAKTIEPRTGVEFPTMLGDIISGESNYSFTPEKLGPKYACIPENELNKRQDFYQDLLRSCITETRENLQGTTINFRRTADGHLITEGAFFDMYIGDIPVCEQTKEEIGKNVASIMRMC